MQLLLFPSRNKLYFLKLHKRLHEMLQSRKRGKLVYLDEPSRCFNAMLKLQWFVVLSVSSNQGITFIAVPIIKEGTYAPGVKFRFPHCRNFHFGDVPMAWDLVLRLSLLLGQSEKTMASKYSNCENELNHAHQACLGRKLSLLHSPNLLLSPSLWI